MFRLLVRATLDPTRQIHDRQLEREIQGRQQNGEEDVPAQHVCHERTRSCRQNERLDVVCIARVVLSIIPERRSEEGESWNQGQEDEEEDEVRAEGEDHVEEAEDAHEEEKEGY